MLSKQKTLSSEKEILAEATQKLAALEGLNEYELSAKAERILAVLPTEKDPARLIMTIRYLADLTGVKLEGINVKPGEISAGSSQAKGKEQAVPLLTFQVDAGGSQEAIGEFLDKIQSTAPLMRIEKATISSKGADFLAKLELETFYLPLPPILGSVEKPLPEISPEEDEIYESLAKLEVISTEISFTPVATGKENPFTF